MKATPSSSLDLSVVIPAHDEELNVEPLLEELSAVLDGLAVDAEIIVVDDGSADATRERLRQLAERFRRLRPLALAGASPGRALGQSAAFAAGIRAAGGALIATLDADLQNDPADLPDLLERLRSTGADMVQGDRTASRRDPWLRRITSRVGYRARRLLLGDTIRDTGCSLRVMRREVAVALPLELRGLHRFVPVTARQLGFTVVEHPVHHRPRVAGTAQYGVWNRAIPGLIDCLGVRWMASRRRATDAMPIERKPAATVITVATTRPPAPVRDAP